MKIHAQRQIQKTPHCRLPVLSKHECRLQFYNNFEFAIGDDVSESNEQRKRESVEVLETRYEKHLERLDGTKE